MQQLKKRLAINGKNPKGTGSENRMLYLKKWKGLRKRNRLLKKWQKAVKKAVKAKPVKKKCSEEKSQTGKEKCSEEKSQTGKEKCSEEKSSIDYSSRHSS